MVSAVFVANDGPQATILVREMGRLCTTPWNYTLPNQATLSASPDWDSELWELLTSQDNISVAFLYNGSWDSRAGNNYQLNFVSQ